MPGFIENIMTGRFNGMEITAELMFYALNRTSDDEHEEGTPCAYTALDLMHDMLQYCLDVSERIMVLSLQFCLSQLTPEEVVGHYGRSEEPWLGSTICKRREELRASNDQSMESEIASCERRTQLLATVDLFRKMVDCSCAMKACCEMLLYRRCQWTKYDYWLAF